MKAPARTQFPTSNGWCESVEKNVRGYVIQVVQSMEQLLSRGFASDRISSEARQWFQNGKQNSTVSGWRPGWQAGTKRWCGAWVKRSGEVQGLTWSTCPQPASGVWSCCWKREEHPDSGLENPVRLAQTKERMLDPNIWIKMRGGHARKQSVLLWADRKTFQASCRNGAHQMQARQEFNEPASKQKWLCNIILDNNLFWLLFLVIWFVN